MVSENSKKIISTFNVPPLTIGKTEDLTMQSITEAFEKFQKEYVEPLYFGFIMNGTTYDKMLEYFPSKQPVFTNIVSFGGMVIGIHEEVPDGIMLPAKDERHYHSIMYILNCNDGWNFMDRLIKEIQDNEQ